MSVLEKLRKICERATKEEWEHVHDGEYGRGVLTNEDVVQTNHTHGTRSWSRVVACAAHGHGYSKKDDAFHNMEHIATFNPTTVLTLLDALEECTKALDFYRDGANWESHEHSYPSTPVISEEDEEFLTTIGRHCGGKRARATLKTIEEKLKGLDAPTGQ